MVVDMVVVPISPCPEDIGVKVNIRSWGTGREDTILRLCHLK